MFVLQEVKWKLWEINPNGPFFFHFTHVRLVTRGEKVKSQLPKKKFTFPAAKTHYFIEHKETGYFTS